MSRPDAIIQLLEKYRFRSSVDPAVRHRILGSKKRTHALILRRETKDSPFISPIVSLYYRLRSLGIGATLAGSARLMGGAAAFALVLIAVSAALTLQHAVFDRGPLVIARGVVTFKAGSALLSREGEAAREAAIGDVVTGGVTVETGAMSRLNIQVGDAAVISIQPDTRVRLSSLFEKGEALLDLEGGSLLSRLKALRGRSSYAIRTRNCYAAVRGTEFSVAYDGAATTVAVKEGSVMVSHLDARSGKILKERPVESGNTAVIRGTLEVNPISGMESLELERISVTPFLDDVEEMSREDLVEEAKLQEKREEAIQKKINAGLGVLTLDEIREQYGQVHEIRLYNGRVYLGAILSRGGIFTIQTTRGIVRVPAAKIMKTRAR